MYTVDKTVEENSSVFSLIRMPWLLSARACGQLNFAPTKSSSFDWRCRLTHVDRYNGRKMVVVVLLLLMDSCHCNITIRFAGAQLSKENARTIFDNDFYHRKTDRQCVLQCA